MAEEELLVEPDRLLPLLGSPDLIVVDLSDADNFARGHIPGAIHMPYSELTAGAGPAPGLLPDNERLLDAVARTGLAADSLVVACDNTGSGRASRLVWTLHYLGFRNARVLNGGLAAWKAVAGELTVAPGRPPDGAFAPKLNPEVLADYDYVLARLGDPDTQILDARSPAEYAGSDVRSARGGHIPGAINLNWQDTIDPRHDMRFLTPDVLGQMLERLGFRVDCEVITYCQTHHRSAHSYVMLRYAGFPRVRGYAGSWAEWGNRPDAPVE